MKIYLNVARLNKEEFAYLREAFEGFEGDDFDSLETSFNKDGKTGYNDIMNAFVKETIKNGGCSAIVRHKGTKVVAK